MSKDTVFLRVRSYGGSHVEILFATTNPNLALDEIDGLISADEVWKYENGKVLAIWSWNEETKAWDHCVAVNWDGEKTSEDLNKKRSTSHVKHRV